MRRATRPTPFSPCMLRLMVEQFHISPSLAHDFSLEVSSIYLLYLFFLNTLTAVLHGYLPRSHASRCRGSGALCSYSLPFLFCAPWSSHWSFPAAQSHGEPWLVEQRLGC